MQRGKGRGWLVPALALALGGAYFVAAWIRGDLELGVVLFAIMAGYAILLLVGGRFDVVSVLRGQPTDERYRSFDLRASAFAGLVTIMISIGGLLYELARGQDLQPFVTLCAVAGASYIAALIWLHWRA